MRAGHSAAHRDAGAAGNGEPFRPSAPARPQPFPRLRQFVEEQQNYRPVADAVALLLAGNKLNDAELNALSDLIGEQDIEPLLQAANSDRDDAQAARQELVSMLMDRHGTSRVLFRNTRNGVKGFPKRELHTIRLPLPTQYQTAIKVSGIMGARKNGRRARPRHALSGADLSGIEGDTGTWWNFDPRVEWLMGHLTSHRSQKVLVICAKAATALQLEQVLREREGIRAAVFHEGMSIIERDRAAAWFAEEDTGAQVLLCSEIGSEGRNFQFASNLVMFDLPFNPDLLEQRIGRLDVSARPTIFRSTFRIWKEPPRRCWCAGITKVWTRSSTPARPAVPFTTACIMN